MKNVPTPAARRKTNSGSVVGPAARSEHRTVGAEEQDGSIVLLLAAARSAFRKLSFTPVPQLGAERPSMASATVFQCFKTRTRRRIHFPRYDSFPRDRAV